MALTSNALLPLAYWYGHADTKKNPLLMERLIRNLGDNIHDRFELDTQGIDSLHIFDHDFLCPCRQSIWDYCGFPIVICLWSISE